MEEMMIQKEFRKEQKEHLYNAIQMLNDRQKEALFLRYYHGLTSNEIAIVMDVNPQSVRNHLARAIARLQSLLKVSPSISNSVLLKLYRNKMSTPGFGMLLTGLTMHTDFLCITFIHYSLVILIN